MTEDMLKAIAARAEAARAAAAVTMFNPGDQEPGQQEANLTFVARARQDVSRLVAEVRRLTAENAEMLGLLSDRALDSDVAQYAVRRERERTLAILDYGINFALERIEAARRAGRDAPGWSARASALDMARASIAGEGRAP